MALSSGFKAKAAVGLLGALLGLILLAPSAPARPLPTGFLDDASLLNPEPAVSDVWFGRAEAAGASLTRINVYWSNIAPPARPAAFDPADPADSAYRWRGLDVSVRNAVAHGLTPILTVLRAPAWAEGPGRAASAPEGTWRPDANELAAFARALARRFDGTFPNPDLPGSTLPRVRYFQGWNEPNLYYYLTPQFENGRPVSPAIYRSLLDAFYRAVKSVQPYSVVISAGLAPIARPNATTGPLKFMRLLTCMKGGPRPRPSCSKKIEADIWATHPYTTGGPTHEAAGRDDVSLGDLPEMAALLRAADRYGHINGRYRRVPFWVTEFSWDTGPPDPGGVPMRIAKRWVPEALYRMWSAGVSAVIWLTIQDGPSPKARSGWGDTYQSGFYRYHRNAAKARAKPTLPAFRFPLVAFTSRPGVAFWGRTPTSEAGHVVLQARTARGWRSVGTARAARSGVFHGVLPLEVRRGFLRASFGPEVSVPFSLTPVRDRYVRPFGG